MWFLNKKVILTKDNLIKRNWSGCKRCAFCPANETVEHLFISCPFVKSFWQLIHFTFNITPPSSIANMFGHWQDRVDKKNKACIRIGVCVFLWDIWNSRNDVVFNKIRDAHFLQVVHRAIYLIQLWSLLLPLQQRTLMDAGCNRLMAVVRAICCQHGWQHARRLQHV